MKRSGIGLVLGVLLVLEIGVAVAIVLAYPGGFGALASFNVGPERRQDQPVQTFDMGGQSGMLVINNGAGRVTVEADSNATAVTVNATKVVNGGNDDAFNRLSYNVNQTGNTINIKAERIGAPVGLNFGERVDITITAPRNVAANIQTGSGNVRVTGLESPDQAFNLETGSGNIAVSAVKGQSLRFKTGSGNLTADTILGGLDAETSSGDIRIQSANVSALRMHTGSGNINFNGQAILTANTEIGTGSGNVELNFASLGNTPPRFDVSTGSGNINFSVNGLSIQNNDRHHLVTGNSGPVVKVSTGSGNVRVTG